MLFDPVAKFITKRHKLIVVVWMVALLASVPFFAKTAGVTASQTGIGGATGQSATAQTIIDNSFSQSSGSGGTLFLVISASNVTAPSIRGFVDSYAKAAQSDASLKNLTSVGSVYGSVTRVVSGAVSAVDPVRNGTATAANLEFGVPAAFVQIWNSSFGEAQQSIPQAESATSAVLSSSITNKTEEQGALLYLGVFTKDLSSNFQASPSAPVNALIGSSINQAARQVIPAFLPASESTFALDVLTHFTLANYTNPAAIENFVTSEVPQITLYTQAFAAAVYPLSSSPPGSNETTLVDSIVANFARYDLPTYYQNSVTGYVSPNHQVMIVLLNFKDGVSTSEVNAVRALVTTVSAQYGLQDAVKVTGDQALSDDFSQSSMNDLFLILPITIIILIGATGIFFRSVVTPAISLAGIGLALGIADSFILYLVGTYVVVIDPNVPEILLTVLIGVGTDYSVFLLARYREERVRGADKFAAVHNSVTWAGESIATSGLTVIIAFLFLGIFQDVSLLRSMGLLVGAGVLVALAASLTLIPSIVLMVPNRVFWPNVGARFGRYAEKVETSIQNKSGYFSKSAKFSIKHAKLITVLALLATAPSVYVWAKAPVGYDFLAAAPKNLPSVQAFDNITNNFGAGTLYPTYAVAVFDSPVWNGSAYNVSEMRIIDSLSNTTLAQTNVNSVTGPTRPSGERVEYAALGSDPRSKLLESSINKMLSTNGTIALISIDLTASPQSQTSINTAQDLRSLYQSIVQQYPSSLKAIYLGGTAGATVDEKDSVNGQFDAVIAYVMIGVAAVLLVVLGSLFLPLFAIVSIVMSISWTIAATDIVFQGLYNFPIVFITPLTLFVLLLGLGMDYNVFILTRIREEATKGQTLNGAITTAIERTGGIITAAALILAGSLGSLMLSNNLLLKEFGFAFFYSILIDAMVVRTYIVPSVMSLAGKWNWYAPGRLQRVKMVAPEQ